MLVNAYKGKVLFVCQNQYVSAQRFVISSNVTFLKIMKINEINIFKCQKKYDFN